MVKHALRLLRYIPALGWMALIYRTSSVPGLKSVPWAQRAHLLPTDLPSGTLQVLELLIRKGAHLGSYAVLALLLVWALAADLERRRAAQVALMLALLYAIGDEWHQSFVPDRAGRWFDVVIDGTGASGGLWLWWRLSDRPRPHRLRAQRRNPHQG